MMTHCSDPRDALELLLLRERMRDWRFYDHFRTDRDAPARRPQVGTYTPVLGSDGSDLAAALQTIREIGSDVELGEAIADAFPGASIEIVNTDGYFELEMQAARPAAPVEGGRAFRRHAPLSAADRRALVAPPAEPDDPQRARDEPASRPAAAAGAAHRAGLQTIADRGRLPCRGAGVRACGGEPRRGRSCSRSNWARRWCRAANAGLDLAVTLTAREMSAVTRAKNPELRFRRAPLAGCRAAPSACAPRRSALLADKRRDGARAR